MEDLSLENPPGLFLPNDPSAQPLAHGAAAEIWVTHHGSPSTVGATKLVSKVMRVNSKDFQSRFNRGQTAEPWQAFLQQYRMQASLWSKLHHDNVVKILALGRGLDLQVEYCENRSVREYLIYHDDVNKAQMICDTLSGLEYLHAQGPAIVHGNLNAGKIFVDASGITKIGEFGLTALCSKFAGSLPDVSMEGLSRWMSPELLDPHQEDVAGTVMSDVWALGCTIFEIVAEKLPYAKCRHEMKIQKEILAGKLPGNYESILDSPSMRALWSLLEGCWTEQPEGRPSVSSLLVQNTITANESANGSEGSISWKQMTWTESVLNIADKPTTSVSYPDYDTPIASKQDLSLNASDVNDEAQSKNPGNIHRPQFQTLGKIDEPQQALSLQGYPDTPVEHSGFGTLHRSQLEQLGNIADLDKAIEHMGRAISLSPHGHLETLIWLSNLGNLHKYRFERYAYPADLDKAIEYQSQAVVLALDDHADKPVWLGNLGDYHQCRFEHLGDLADIEKAILCLSQAVSLTTDGSTDGPVMLNSLDNSHLRRFEHLGDLADISRAIECQSQAVLLTLDGYANKPGWLGNLGRSYLSRFEHLGDLEDINRAILSLYQAVSLTPDGHVRKPELLNNLGRSLLRRYERFGDLVDNDRAIECLSKVVLFTIDGNANKPSWLSNLGDLHLRRFERFADLVDIDRAIACQSQAVLLTPDDHTNRSSSLNTLGASHQKRFERFGDIADIERAITCARMAAHCATGKLSTRFEASRKWAQLSTQFDKSSALSAYQWTIDLLPKVVWIGSTLNSHYEYMQSIEAVAVEAAAVAISAQNYGLALEWLEAGRSIVWSQTLRLRAQFNDLSAVDSELAQTLRTAALNLEDASWQPSGFTAPNNDGLTLEAAAQSHRQLAEQYENLLGRARQVSGFNDFMRPKKAAELMSAAQSGPVVVINVHESRCDALILRPHTREISHVPLHDVSEIKVIDMQRQMKYIVSTGIIERNLHTTPGNHQDSFKSILYTLWSEIVNPVLDSLGYVEKPPIDQLPHITWCTTGTLAMLPIHAAGCYDQTGNNLFAYAVSSYAPTLSSLISSNHYSLDLSGILAVSRELTPPAMKQELAHIKRRAGVLPYLQLENHEATAEAVLDAMQQYNSVHLACHASQNLNQPLESYFHLHDRGLSLADIANVSLKNRGLAFLSACQTATDDDISLDKAIHLAAGMLAAGYPTVIATMWSSMDSDVPIVVDCVYGQLSKDRKLHDGKVARALHVAAAALRNRIGEMELVRWAQYIHMGV